MIYFDINWLAVIIAVPVYMALGWVWYSKALFGNRWASMIGLSDETLKSGAAKAMVGGALMAFLEAAAIGFLFTKVLYDYTVTDGLVVGLLFGFGLIFPVMMVNTLFQRKPFSLFAIDFGFQLLALVAISMVVGGIGL